MISSYELVHGRSYAHPPMPVRKLRDEMRCAWFAQSRLATRACVRLNDWTWTSPRSLLMRRLGAALVQKKFRTSTRPSDTPPVDDLLEAGLLACGSVPLAAFPRYLSGISDLGSPLTVAGAAPELRARHGHRAPYSRLSSYPCESREPRTLYIVAEVKIASIDGFILMKYFTAMG